MTCHNPCLFTNVRLLSIALQGQAHTCAYMYFHSTREANLEINHQNTKPPNHQQSSPLTYQPAIFQMVGLLVYPGISQM